MDCQDCVQKLFQYYTGCLEFKCQNFGSAWRIDKPRKSSKDCSFLLHFEENITSFKNKYNKFSFSTLIYLYLFIHVIFHENITQNINI